MIMRGMGVDWDAEGMFWWFWCQAIGALWLGVEMVDGKKSLEGVGDVQIERGLKLVVHNRVEATIL